MPPKKTGTQTSEAEGPTKTQKSEENRFFHAFLEVVDISQLVFLLLPTHRNKPSKQVPRVHEEFVNQKADKPQERRNREAELKNRNPKKN